MKSAQIQYRAALQADPQLHAARLAFGKLLLAGGDADAAAIELERVVSAAPDTPGAFEAYAQALVAIPNDKRALQVLGTLKPSTSADQALVKAQLGLMWSQLGDTKRSQEALAQALAIDPKHPLALTYSARFAWSQGRPDEASRLVKQALEAAPRHPEALHLDGLLLQANGDAKGAQARWRAALEASPTHVPSYESLIAMHVQANELKLAREQLAALRKRVPWHPSGQLAEARILIAEGELPKARERVLSLLAGAPDHPTLLALAGAIEARVGSLVQAAAHYRKLLAARPDQARVRVELAQVEVRLAQYPEAARTLRPLLSESDVAPRVLALASEIELRQGNFKLADELLRRATDAAPSDAQLQAARLVRQMRLGEVEQPLAQLEQLAGSSKELYADEALFAARMALGDYEAALQALDRMVTKQPGQARHAELRARVHLERRDLAKARQALEEAQKLDPKGFGAVAALAMVDTLEDRPDQAMARVKRVVDADPGHTAALMLLADLKSKESGFNAEALALLKRAVDSSPTSAEPRLKLIEIALSRRQHKEALELARSAVAALPSDERLLDASGRAQLLSGDVEQAATTFRALAGLMPRSAAPLMQLARVYDVQGRRDSVLTTMQRAVELEPSNEAVQRAYVDMLLSSRQSAQALTHVRKLRERAPNDPLSFVLLATVQERSRDTAAAAATLRDGLARTDSPDLARRLYALLLRSNRLDDASALATQWMRRNPDDTGFEYLIAEYEIVSGKLKAAEERLRRVVKAHPGNALALNNLAWVVARQGGPDAVVFARRALSVSPERPDLLDTLAFALSSSGKHQDAMAVQRRAIDLAPNAAVFRLGMAKIAVAAGDKALAKAEIDAVRKLDATLGAGQQVKELEARL